MAIARKVEAPARWLQLPRQIVKARCIVFLLQEDVKKLYKSPDFMKKLGDLQDKCGSSANKFLDELETFADDQKADILETYGFTGWAGARAAERAISSKIDDPVVRKNARELFDLLTDGYNFDAPGGN